MKLKRIKLVSLLILLLSLLWLVGCDVDNTQGQLSNNIKEATNLSSNIVENQPVPEDLNYSLERYNLIKRAYWVNGQREKATSLPCSIDRPLGYIILFSGNGATIGRFIVDGKVSSLGSYLFPAYQNYDWAGRSVGDINLSSSSSVYNQEIPGIDGAYGSNVTGIFFFTTDGKYVEWTGDFLYSDIPFEVNDPVLKVEGEK